VPDELAPVRCGGPTRVLLIPCPWCGPRDEEEFAYGGEAHRMRPAEPERVDDAAWAGYLFMRANPRGLHLERWVHVHGCRRWFNVARDTATERIEAVYRIGEPPPPGTRP
jgi:heterotetrameric sarcosine oxidase delta subunit